MANSEELDSGSLPENHSLVRVIPEIRSLIERVDSLESLDFDSAQRARREAYAIVRHVFGENSAYAEGIAAVHFRPEGFIYNEGHYMNKAAWNDGVSAFKNILEVVDKELSLMRKDESPVKVDVTFKWLISNLPKRYWIAGVSALVISFALGKNDFFVSFVELLRNSVQP